MVVFTCDHDPATVSGCMMQFWLHQDVLGTVQFWPLSNILMVLYLWKCSKICVLLPTWSSCLPLYRVFFNAVLVDHYSKILSNCRSDHGITASVDSDVGDFQSRSQKLLTQSDTILYKLQNIALSALQTVHRQMLA